MDSAHPQDKTAQEGDVVSFYCNVTANPDANVTWENVATNETVGVGRTFNTTATKELNKAGFRCVAENAIGRTASRRAVFTVHCE